MRKISKDLLELCKVERAISQSMYAYKMEYYYDHHDIKKDYLLDYRIAYDKLKEYMQTSESVQMYHKAANINKAYRKRRSRIRDRIEKMISTGSTLFLTLTFSDDYYNVTKDTLRQHVRRYLNEFHVPYVANIDYGSQTERCHFHAVIQLDHIDLKSWKYGFMWVEKVKVGKKNYERISTYITKLTFHACKMSTIDEDIPNIIYSRKK